MQSNLRIHIAPVGFDFRRVTEPLIRMRADMVYIVKYIHDDDDIAYEFYDKIKNELEVNYRHIQVKEIHVDLWNLYECMGAFRKIMLEEKKNHVYVNVSTGTKITSIAGMLSCMMWNAHPYYVPISYVGREKRVNVSEHVDEPEDLPTYSINKPHPEFMLILDLLSRNGGVMRKARLIKELEDKGVIDSRDMNGNELSSPAKHSRLRALLDPMERHWNLVSVQARGRRSEVYIQKQGETALKIFGTGSYTKDKKLV